MLLGAVGLHWFTERPAVAAPSFQVDRLQGEHQYDTVADQFRVYRADAVVSLLSITVFSRAGVGSGFAGYREARRSGESIATMRFAGGSFPQRAHNLNRFGLIQEVVISKDGAPTEAAYFGFMTSSPEEGLSDAKRAMDANAGTAQYVAAEGHLTANRFRATQNRFFFPARFTWADRNSMMQEVRSRFQAGERVVRDSALDGGKWPNTLMHLMAAAIREHPDHLDADYVYNAKQFHLRLDKSADPKAGAAFAAKGLTKRPADVVQFRGVIKDYKTAKLTKFRIWTEEGTPTLLPLRIELQARSFLALSFEFDPNLPMPKESQNI